MTFIKHRNIFFWNTLYIPPLAHPALATIECCWIADTSRIVPRQEISFEITRRSIARFDRVDNAQISHTHRRTDRQTEWLPGLPVEAKKHPALCLGISKEAWLFKLSSTLKWLLGINMSVSLRLSWKVFLRLISTNQSASFKSFHQWQTRWMLALVSPPLRSLRNKYYHISVSWNLDTVFLLQRSNWNSPRQLCSVQIFKILWKIFSQKMWEAEI